MKKRGPKISCKCGKCFKCLQREYQRKRRKGLTQTASGASARLGAPHGEK